MLQLSSLQLTVRFLHPFVKSFIEVDHAENGIGQLSKTYGGDICTNVLESKGFFPQDVPASINFKDFFARRSLLDRAEKKII